MHTKKLILVVSVGIGCLFPFFASAKNSDSEQRPAGKIVSLYNSKSVIIIDPTEKQRRNASVEDVVYEGDKIVTKKEQAVTLLLNEKTEITIGPSTSFLVEEYNPSERHSTILSLAYGIIRALVKKTYEPGETFAVKTSSAAMGVRGTDFIVETNSKTKLTSVHTLEGEVIMGVDISSLRNANKSVKVPAGTTSMLKIGMNLPVAPKSFDQSTFRHDLQQRAPVFEKQMSASVTQTTSIHLRNSSSRAPASANNQHKGTHTGNNGRQSVKIESSQRRSRFREKSSSRFRANGQASTQGMKGPGQFSSQKSNLTPGQISNRLPASSPSSPTFSPSSVPKLPSVRPNAVMNPSGSKTGPSRRPRRPGFKKPGTNLPPPPLPQ